MQLFALFSLALATLAVAVPVEVVQRDAASSFTGDITFFSLGLGACGIDDSGLDSTHRIVAVNAPQMGAQSNDNPMCGRTITIQANGRTTTAVVHDKCPECAWGSIDVSEAVFNDLFYSLDVGRAPVSWWFS